MTIGASEFFQDNVTNLDAAVLNTIDSGLSVHHSPTGLLNYKISAGSVWLSGVLFNFAASGDIVPSPSVTTSVWIDQAGVAQKATNPVLLLTGAEANSRGPLARCAQPLRLFE